MAVDHKRRPIPQIGPGGSFWDIRALAGLAVAVDDLNACNDVLRLFLPWLVGQKSAVDENRIEICFIVGEEHSLEVSPIFRTEFLRCLCIRGLEKLRVTRFPEMEQP